jgi:hypothetical protein
MRGINKRTLNRRNVKRRTLKQRGGNRYWMGKIEKDPKTGMVPPPVFERNFTEGSLKNLQDFKRPFFNGCLLSNVFSTPNTRGNYKPFGYFYSEINNPFDFTSFDWFIENYLDIYVLPKLNEEGTTYGIEFSRKDIKIHNFSIREKNTPTGKTGENYELKGDIYVVIKKLNKQNETTDFSGIPKDEINKNDAVQKEELY